jgi:hypothetical protein
MRRFVRAGLALNLGEVALFDTPVEIVIMGCAGVEPPPQLRMSAAALSTLP